MIGRFLEWIGLGPLRPRRPGGVRPPDGSQRRLAIEPIEDRLLLSATGADTVSDGGTVVLDSFYFAVNSSCDTLQIDGSLSGRLVAVDDRVKPAEGSSTGFVDVQGTLDQVREPFGPTHSPEMYDDQAAPTPEEVTPDDLAPTPPDSGMVDVTHAARDQVFAQIGVGPHEPDSHDLPAVELAADDPLAASAAAVAGLSHEPLESLTGSRGRLAAFDLAMQQETDWRTNMGSDTASDSPTFPTTEAKSPRHAPVAPAAFSNLAPDFGGYPIQPNDGLLHPVSASKSTRTTQDSHITLALPNGADPPELAPVNRSPGSPVDSDGAADASLPAVYLDQRREKPMAHLVMAIGVGQALMGRRPQFTDDPEHEQLPPRKRS